MNESISRLRAFLIKVYSESQVNYLIKEIQFIIDDFKKKYQQGHYRLSESSIALFCYADSIQSKEVLPLKALEQFISENNLNSYFEILHLLPFYPWDTDRGFSVKDYYKVEPKYGSWEEMNALSKKIKLMFDFVANHASIDNPLVQASLIAKHLPRDNKLFENYSKYKDFVIAYAENERPADELLKSLSRPRAYPVLTPYTVFFESGFPMAVLGSPGKAESIIGEGFVWTTFSRGKSEDGSEATRQVDLNFANPDLFLEIIRILFFYLQNEAELIRLDAIGYIWKNLGHSSLHEPQVHYLLASIKLIIDLVSPQAITISEVNEPQDKVFAYLGSSEARESDAVYQFTHFPLAIEALVKESVQNYADWVLSTNKFEGKQFITVLGSHDGMGLKPVRSLLEESDVDSLIKILVEKFKTLPNFASLPGGKKIVYELCATAWNLVNRDDENMGSDLQIQRYLLVSFMGLCLRGIPGFYLNGLLGVSSYYPKDGLDENRTVNREVFHLDRLSNILKDPNSRMSKVLKGILQLIYCRKKENAFAPDALQLRVINTGEKAVLSTEIRAKNKQDLILAFANVSSSSKTIKVSGKDGTYQDLLSSKSFSLQNNNQVIELEPYEYNWYKFSF